MWQKFLSALGFIVLLVAMVIGGGIGKIFGKSAGDAAFGSSKPTQQEIEEKLIEGFNKAAEQSNRLGPRMVDKDTQWDTTTVGPGARVTYYYSLPNYSSREITSAQLDANLKPVVRNGVCTNKEMRPSLTYGGIYVYVYRGNDGAEIIRFTFSQHDCNLSSERSIEQTPAVSSAAVNWGDFTPVPKPSSAPPAPSAQEVHMQRIYAVHPDANEIYMSAEFARWLTRTQKFKHVTAGGTTQEVIDMFSAYKRRSKAENQRLDQSLERRNNAAAEALAPQSACEYKAVMTDDDYFACGVNPPSHLQN